MQYQLVRDQPDIYRALVTRYSRAMKIAKGMCHRNPETKRHASKAWVDEMYTALGKKPPRKL